MAIKKYCSGSGARAVPGIVQQHALQLLLEVIWQYYSGLGIRAVSGIVEHLLRSFGSIAVGQEPRLSLG